MAILGDGSKRINGVSYSWSSIKLIIENHEIEFLGSLNYSDKRERAKGYGMGRSHRPKKRSAGKYAAEALKMKGFLGGISEMRNFLCQYAIDQTSYGNVIFDVHAAYIEMDETPVDVKIAGCAWGENNDDQQEGPDLLMSECAFDAMYIVRYRDGKAMTLFDASEEVAI